MVLYRKNLNWDIGYIQQCKNTDVKNEIKNELGKLSKDFDYDIIDITIDKINDSMYCSVWYKYAIIKY